MRNSNVVDLFPFPEPHFLPPEVPKTSSAHFSTLLLKFQHNDEQERCKKEFRSASKLVRPGVQRKIGIGIDASSSIQIEPFVPSVCGRKGIVSKRSFTFFVGDEGKSLRRLSNQKACTIFSPGSGLISDFDVHNDFDEILISTDNGSVNRLSSAFNSTQVFKFNNLQPGMIKFHPFTRQIALSTTLKNSIHIIDMELQKESYCIDSIEKDIFSVDWKSHLLSATSKDRIVRLFDLRFKNALAQQFVAYSSSRPSQLVWIDGGKSQDSTSFFTLGVESNRSQQLKLWDIRSTGTPLSVHMISSNPIHRGILSFDENSSLVMISSRKSNAVHSFRYDTGNVSVLEYPHLQFDTEHFDFTIHSQHSNSLPEITRLCADSVEFVTLKEKTFFAPTSDASVIEDFPIPLSDRSAIKGSKSLITATINCLEQVSRGDQIHEDLLLLLSDSLRKVMQRTVGKDLKGIETSRLNRQLALQLDDANALIDILQSEVNALRARSQEALSRPFSRNIESTRMHDNDPMRLPLDVGFHQLHKIVLYRSVWNRV